MAIASGIVRGGALAHEEQVGDHDDGRADREGDEARQRDLERGAELVRVEAELLARQRVQGGLGVGHDLGRQRRRRLAIDALRPVDELELLLLLLGLVAQLGGLHGDLALEEVALAGDADVLAGRHAERAGQQAGESGEEHGAVVRGGPGEAHDERGVGDQSVADPEHGRPGRSRTCRRDARARPGSAWTTRWPCWRPSTVGGTSIAVRICWNTSMCSRSSSDIESGASGSASYMPASAPSASSRCRSTSAKPAPRARDTRAASVGSRAVGAGGTGTPYSVSFSTQCSACSSSIWASSSSASRRSPSTVSASAR